jgi:AraC family transcriptional regulator, alkane utilization regulator
LYLIANPAIAGASSKFVDVLSEALKGFRVSGSIFIDADLKAPWAIVTPSSAEIASALGVESDRVIPYHLVTEGSCLATVERQAPMRLVAGDIALFPHGHVHILASNEGIAPTGLSRAFVERVLTRRNILPIRHGGAGQAVKLLCGFFAIDKWGGDHLIKGLPAVLKARIGTDGGQGLLAAVARHSIEARVTGGPGSDALVCKLSEILFVDALRQFILNSDTALPGLLAGLRDPAICRALALVHARPKDPWDIRSLASACAMSRSTFLDRFTEAVGSPPMKYVARWRLTLAARDLSDADITVKQVADRYGYGSEAAFTRAFRSAFDIPPATFRRARGHAKATT